MVIGLRETSPSWNAAKIVGFNEVRNLLLFIRHSHPVAAAKCKWYPLIAQGVQADGTLQAQDKVIKESDLVMLLISDAAQANDYKKKIGENSKNQHCTKIVSFANFYICFRAPPQEGCDAGSLAWFSPWSSGENVCYGAVRSRLD